MLRTTAIAKELAVIERKLQETTNKTLKDALKKKQARLKDELNDFKKSTPSLAKQLLAQRAQIKQLSKMDFNDLVRRLAKKPEYSFLKTLSKSTIKTDIERPAKPVGWRFKGRGNYDKPTMAEIKKGKRNGTVYREVRPLRSDVSQPLRLARGGSSSQVKGDLYFLSAKEKKNITQLFIEFGIPKNEIKINDSLPYTTYSTRYYGFLFRVNLSNYKMFEIGFSNLSISIHANAGGNDKNPELFIEISAKSKGRKKEYINDSYYIELSDDFSSVKKMENGGMIKIGDKIKLNDDGVIRTYTVTEPGMRHPSERLQEGDVYLTSPGVIGFDASIDWVKKNMVYDKMENGGNMKNTHMMEDGGVVGQEIVFDDNGETNTGVIKEIHEITGNYIVATDDGRTVLADKEMDVISLGEMRKQPEAKRRFSFFEDGGKVSREKGYKVGDILRHETFTGEFPPPAYEVIEILQTDSSASFSSRPRSVLKVKNLTTGQISEINEGRFSKYKFEDGGNIAKENNEMLHSQAKEAKHHIEELHNIINNKTKVEPWVVAKMTRAKTDLSDITHYLEGASHKMSKGGKLTDEQQNKFDKVMHEWKQGKLHSGSANGPIVKDQDQAIAIAYSEAYGMDKMLFGGMVNDLSDDAIDRMEGLVPISTLGELLDNAKFIIADMYEEGFEKDEIMSFLAYKISQIGGAKNTNSSSSTPSRHKAQVLVDLYNELSNAKNIEVLEWNYDADEGHFIIFENGLESTSPKHKGQNDQFAFYADEDGKIIAEYILNGYVKSNLTVKEAVKYSRANENVKMANGGGVGSLSPNLLMELWYAVWERKTDKYDEIAKKLDKEGVSFTIQNKVSEDAQKTRSRKAIDTFEVQDRIKKIMGNTKMSTGGAVKGSKPSTGEKFGVVVGSKKHSDEYINNSTEVNVRKSYGSRISEVKLIFDADNNLFEVIDYGSALDGYPNTSAGSGTKYNADKKETKKLLSQMYNASFATKLLDDISNKMVKGGGVGLRTDADIKKGDQEYIKSGEYKSYLENKLEYLKKENVSRMYDWERKRHLDKIDDIEKIIDDLTHRPAKVRTIKYAKGGGVGSKKQDYIEVTNGDTILSLEKTNGVWEEVDVLQGVKPVNFGRNTYKGNLQQEALIKALNAEYGGGYKVAYVYMNMNGGKMADGGKVEIRPASKSSKKYVVWDNKTQMPWANEKFNSIKEAEEFIKQNNLQMSKGGNARGWKHKHMA